MDRAPKNISLYAREARGDDNMAMSPDTIKQAIEVTKAAVGAGEASGREALTRPEAVAKLIEVVAQKIQELAESK